MIRGDTKNRYKIKEKIDVNTKRKSNGINRTE